MKTMIMEKLNFLNEKVTKDKNAEKYISNKKTIKTMKEDIQECGEEINKDNISLYYQYMSDDELLLNAQYLTNIDIRFHKVKELLHIKDDIQGYYGDHIKLYGVILSNDKKVVEKLNFIQGNYLLRYSLFNIKDTLEDFEEYVQKVKTAMDNFYISRAS